MSNVNYKLAAEVAFFKHYVSNIYPNGVCSYVSDTYNFWDVISIVAKKAKPEILARTPNAIGLSKVVFRPDSGDPVEVLAGVEVHDLTDDLTDEEGWDDWIRDLISDNHDVGYEEQYDIEVFFRVGEQVYKATAHVWWNSYENYAEIDSVDWKDHTLTPAEKGAVQCLWEVFGGTETSTGHKLLDSHVGLIYGDSITLERAINILTRLEKKGFASANVVFGIGSFTYQYNTRDNYGFAVKSTAGKINGEMVEIFKDPITDAGGVKKSAKGFLVVERDESTHVKYILKDQQESYEGGELEVVFRNGQLIRDETLETIRGRVNSHLTI